MYRNLNAEMCRRGLLQKELAKKLHLTLGTMSLKLRGKTPFTLDEALEIKKILNDISELSKDINIEKLFEKSGNPEPTTKERK
jgi:transcriptional regulator with XRE-family HTH domain